MRTIVTVALITLAAGFPASSQPPGPIPQFDVASIKPQPWTGNGSFGVRVSGNTLSAQHTDVVDLVEFAYDLKGFQLSGGPAWARHGVLDSSVLFQVTAKVEGDPPPIDQFRVMLQGLLADRFQLQIHHVRKDMPVYNLVVAKNGPKLKESAPDAKFSMAISGGAVIKIVATHAPISKLIGHLNTDHPVLDKTGLTGNYDFELEFATDGSADPRAASIFTAVPERLGLRFEAGMAPFDTVVIDHVEKPTGN